MGKTWGFCAGFHSITQTGSNQERLHPRCFWSFPMPCSTNIWSTIVKGYPYSWNAWGLGFLISMTCSYPVELLVSYQESHYSWTLTITSDIWMAYGIWHLPLARPWRHGSMGTEGPEGIAVSIRRRYPSWTNRDRACQDHSTLGALWPWKRQPDLRLFP